MEERVDQFKIPNAPKGLNCIWTDTSGPFSKVLPSARLLIAVVFGGLRLRRPLEASHFGLLARRPRSSCPYRTVRVASEGSTTRNTSLLNIGNEGRSVNLSSRLASQVCPLQARRPDDLAVRSEDLGKSLGMFSM